MPCLHPRSGLASCNRDAEKPRQNNERAIRFPERKCAHPFTEDHGQRSRDHAPDVSDTWLSEAASELLPSWREARRLMLEAHRLPESARFVEADSRGVKSAKHRNDAGFQRFR